MLKCDAATSHDKKKNVRVWTVRWAEDLDSQGTAYRHLGQGEHAVECVRLNEWDWSDWLWLIGSHLMRTSRNNRILVPRALLLFTFGVNFLVAIELGNEWEGKNGEFYIATLLYKLLRDSIHSYTISNRCEGKTPKPTFFN